MATNCPDSPSNPDSKECTAHDPHSGGPQEPSSGTEAGGPEAPAEPSREAIVEALKTVEDPELFLDIWFLGLIYDIRIDGGDVGIDMTFTSPMCPAGPQLKHEVLTKVGAVAGVKNVAVQITFQPPWEPSEEVKGMLGML
jgi:metal-sulfur cluster biosynthetic enzyme